MQVDIIEAGFPAASNGDFNAVKAVANAIKDSTVCGLARATKEDINRAGEALKECKFSTYTYVHCYIANSHGERNYVCLLTKCLKQAVRFCESGRTNLLTMWSSHPRMQVATNIDFLCRVLEAVIKAGATTLNIPDTVGYTMPEQFGGLIHSLRERIPNSDKVIFSVHCHNDLRL